jgi:hypothetical protein
MHARARGFVVLGGSYESRTLVRTINYPLAFIGNDGSLCALPLTQLKDLFSYPSALYKGEYLSTILLERTPIEEGCRRESLSQVDADTSKIVPVHKAVNCSI